MHETLLSLDLPQKEDEKISLLEKKFRAVVNANLISESSGYFNQLCGGNGLNPSIDDVKGDPDVLIKIAREQRTMKKELEELRSYKAKNEASIAAEKRADDLKSKKRKFEDNNTPDPSSIFQPK